MKNIMDERDRDRDRIMSRLKADEAKDKGVRGTGGYVYIGVPPLQVKSS